MRMNVTLTLLLTGLSSVPSRTQVSPTLVSGGHDIPFVALASAPGQVMTIFVRGMGNNITERVAARSTPLPTTLAEISVILVQSARPDLGELLVPLLAVFPSEPCGYVGPGCERLLGITVQIPFELLFDAAPGMGGIPNLARLQISDHSGPVPVVLGPVVLLPSSSTVHILQNGDSIGPGLAGERKSGILTHADGSLVTPANPAKIGEQIVMYAVGLGRTSPEVKTGEASPAPAAPLPVLGLTLSFEFRPNASAYNPFVAGQTYLAPGSPPPALPLFVGFVPGSVGLYQVNFTVPAPAMRVPACSRPGGSAPGAPYQIYSNLTVTLISGRSPLPFGSFDGAGFCVEPFEGSPGEP